MFDFHMHSRLSFDALPEASKMVLAAEKNGLKEICFTDHYDFNSEPTGEHHIFTSEQYMAEYGDLSSSSVLIRRGLEFGMTTWNQKELDQFLSRLKLDFVIGSVHYVDGYDPYEPEYWVGKTMRQGFDRYLEHSLECVKVQDGYDVLGHLNYVCKSPNSPTHEPLLYKDYADICDEIMKTVISKGKGMEINTSGVDRVGDFLPSAAFLKRYKELGGEIITVGSDAHTPDRVGQYTRDALEILKDIFGYVCTFENRKPIFHKL